MQNAVLTGVCFLFFTTTALAADDPSTADFDFLLGDWEIEAALGQAGELNNKSVGVRSCAYILDKAYIRCEAEMTRANGRVSKSNSLHNYNSIYGYHESLYYSGSVSWPIKVLGVSVLEEQDGVLNWTNNFEFLIDEGRTEWVRAEMVVTENMIEASEYIKRSGGPDSQWNLEYTERWIRINSGTHTEN